MWRKPEQESELIIMTKLVKHQKLMKINHLRNLDKKKEKI